VASNLLVLSNSHENAQGKDMLKVSWKDLSIMGVPLKEAMYLDPEASDEDVLSKVDILAEKITQNLKIEPRIHTEEAGRWSTREYEWAGFGQLRVAYGHYPDGTTEGSTVTFSSYPRWHTVQGVELLESLTLEAIQDAYKSRKGFINPNPGRFEVRPEGEKFFYLLTLGSDNSSRFHVVSWNRNGISPTSRR